jgi:hypothetical protein
MLELLLVAFLQFSSLLAGPATIESSAESTSPPTAPPPTPNPPPPTVDTGGNGWGDTHK